MIWILPLPFPFSPVSKLSLFLKCLWSSLLTGEGRGERGEGVVEEPNLMTARKQDPL
jgi:hypothetical protein